MTPAQEKAPARWRTVRRFLVRLVVVLAVALAVGTGLNRVAERYGEATPGGGGTPGTAVAEAGAAGGPGGAREPAGFGRGVVQGALMPLALPSLLLGRDVAIYAARNTGRTYKLGYTVGVNGCGAIFFGILFWRLHRLRRHLQNVGSARKPESNG